MNLQPSTKYHVGWIYCLEVIAGGASFCIFSYFGSFLTFLFFCGWKINILFFKKKKEMLGHKLMQIQGCLDLKKNSFTRDLKVCRKTQVFHITIWKVYCRLQMAISWLDFWFCRVQCAHILNWFEATNFSFNPWISNFTMTEMNVNQTNFL